MPRTSQSSGSDLETRQAIGSETCRSSTIVESLKHVYSFDSLAFTMLAKTSNVLSSCVSETLKNVSTKYGWICRLIGRRLHLISFQHFWFEWHKMCQSDFHDVISNQWNGWPTLSLKTIPHFERIDWLSEHRRLQ